MNEFILKVIIPDESDPQKFTVYLFDPINNILLSFLTDEWGCRSIMEAGLRKECPRPHIHDTAFKLIKCLGGDLGSVVVYRVCEGLFYAYLRIIKNNEVLDLDVKLSDAVCLSLRANVPIYIESSVVKKAGIKVTKELILRSLELDL